MGGFKKVIQRAPYKERSQPKARKNLGLLEKHKDYSLRAADYNRKKTQLASLRSKALDRNEDEFHHGMLSRRGPSGSTSSLLGGSKKWSGVVSGDRGNRALDVEAARLLKTQDLGYVRTVRNVAQREVARLRERVVVAEAMLGDIVPGADPEDEDEGSEFGFSEDDGGDGPVRGEQQEPKPKPKKIIFVDDAETRDEQVSRAEDLQQGDIPDPDKDTNNIEIRKLQLQRLRRRLATAEGKLKALTTAEHEMEQQRVRMGKTPTRGVVTKKGKKIKVALRKR